MGWDLHDSFAKIRIFNEPRKLFWHFQQHVFAEISCQPSTSVMKYDLKRIKNKNKEKKKN